MDRQDRPDRPVRHSAAALPAQYLCRLIHPHTSRLLRHLPVTVVMVEFHPLTSLAPVLGTGQEVERSALGTHLRQVARAARNQNISLKDKLKSLLPLQQKN